MRSVQPSGADFATNSAPIWPLAPGRFSTTIGCAQIPASFGSMMRASVSAPPPGGKGTTMCTGFDGNPWESAPAADKSNARPVNAPPTGCIRMSPRTRPEDALASGPHRTYAFVYELLHALAFVSFRRVEVALGVGRDAVHAVELPGLAPAVAEVRNLLQRLTQYDAHLLVLAIGEEHEALPGILRERDIPGRARGERLLGIEPFLHERPVGAEYLHAVALAVAHVDQAVVRAFDAMHRVAELLGRRRFRIVVA